MDSLHLLRFESLDCCMKAHCIGISLCTLFLEHCHARLQLIKLIGKVCLSIHCFLQFALGIPLLSPHRIDCLRVFFLQLSYLMNSLHLLRFKGLDRCLQSLCIGISLRCPILEHCHAGLQLIELIGEVKLLRNHLFQFALSLLLLNLNGTHPLFVVCLQFGHPFNESLVPPFCRVCTLIVARRTVLCSLEFFLAFGMDLLHIMQLCQMFGNLIQGLIMILLRLLELVRKISMVLLHILELGRQLKVLFLQPL
mmetsp:Transcript_20092/g.34592  ORF Transcript_20092/g.34592 Transcript_20092/m.34592 type:complete len:252 (+) Transcript_20092:3350-4105(+)